MLLNPVAAILFNTKTKRWHPIFYRKSPLPGPDAPGKPVRHRSLGHHTEDFATRPEALQSIEETVKRVIEAHKAPSVALALAEDQDMAWDGQDIPADVAFFDIKPDHTARRLL
jgi:hypothetical protein